MRKQSVNQESENNSMEVALGALGRSIARWTDKGDQPMTVLPIDECNGIDTDNASSIN